MKFTTVFSFVFLHSSYPRSCFYLMAKGPSFNHDKLDCSVHSFFPSFPSFIPSFIPSFRHSFSHSFRFSFRPSVTHSLTHSLTHSVIDSFLHYFVPSFLRSFILSFILSIIVFKSCSCANTQIDMIDLCSCHVSHILLIELTTSAFLGHSLPLIVSKGREQIPAGRLSLQCCGNILGKASPESNQFSPSPLD